MHTIISYITCVCMETCVITRSKHCFVCVCLRLQQHLHFIWYFCLCTYMFLYGMFVCVLICFYKCCLLVCVYLYVLLRWSLSSRVRRLCRAVAGVVEGRRHAPISAAPRPEGAPRAAWGALRAPAWLIFVIWYAPIVAGPGCARRAPSAVCARARQLGRARARAPHTRRARRAWAPARAHSPRPIEHATARHLRVYSVNCNNIQDPESWWCSTSF